MASENEGTIETQLSAVYQFAQKNGYNIVQKYIDEGWSGDSLARPALDQMRNDAKQKIWQAVLIYDPDRLARRYSYQELVMDELCEAGIEVIFVTVSAPKNSEDKIFHGVRGLFAEYERAKISERFRLGKLRKVKEGHVLVSEAPYGYNYISKIENTHGYYEINTEEARVVRMIFGWVADESFTLRKVVRELQDLNIKPRKSKRGVWSTSTLSTLLRNEAYIGKAHWGASYAVVPKNPTNKERYRKTKKSSRKVKPKAEWYIISVPSIIDEKLFLKARIQLNANYAMCERNKKNEYLIAGKIWCSCGKRRGGEGPQHGKHLYYRCNDRTSSFPLPHTCFEKGINARIVDKLVWKKISDLMSSPELISKQTERWMKTRENMGKTVTDDTESIKKELGKLYEQEDRYNKAYGAGLFQIEKLKEYTVPIREKITSLEYRIVKVQEDKSKIIPSILPTSNEIELFTRKSVEALKSLSFESKRAIMLNVIDKVVGNSEKLQVYGYLPITSYVELQSIHRNRRSAKRRKIDVI